MLKKFLKYCAERLKEKSTWLGIVSLLTALGVVISPEQKESIVTAGVAVAGVWAVFIVEQS